MADQAHDYWCRVRDDERLTRARQRLSTDEFRMLFQHARDSLQSPPNPDGEAVRLTASAVPYSSVVGGGLMLANAHAISAVPDMYEALKRIAEWIERERISYLIDTDDNPGQAVRNALAKAEGRQS